ncbi:MAG TPA: tetratricopeptide repeat protein [Pyrinomonadaceae bacterium]|nr:tetratricopeptide repeat protein [Pyrinomonadaceae bacterium]
MKIKTRKQRLKELQSFANKGLNACVIELAEKYLIDFPKSGIAWFIYYEALRNLCNFEEAENALIKAIEFIQNPEENLSWLYLQMGELFEDSGKFLKAIEWFQKAHEANQNEATPLIYQGRMLLRTKKYNEAAETFLKATKCNDGCIDEAFYNLGVVCIAQRKYEEAKIYFKKALEIDPKYKEPKQQLKDVTQILAILINK